MFLCLLVLVQWLSIWMWKRFLDIVCHSWKNKNKPKPNNKNQTPQLFLRKQSIHLVFGRQTLAAFGTLYHRVVFTLSCFHCVESQVGIWEPSESLTWRRLGFQRVFVFRFLESRTACILTPVDSCCQRENLVLARVNPWQENLVAGW